MFYLIGSVLKSGMARRSGEDVVAGQFPGIVNIMGNPRYYKFRLFYVLQKIEFQIDSVSSKSDALLARI
jgi:hypothetical protein